MKKWMRIAASAVLAVCMLLTMMPMGVLAAEDTTVTLADATVLKHGRTYMNGTTLMLDWSNSGVTFNFTGTGAKMTITNSQMEPNPGYINVYVDGDLAPTKVIKMTAASAEYVLAEGLTDGDHTISVRKRNESVYGGSATLGLVNLTITGGALTAAPTMSDRRIEVIGDSITAGFGNLDVGSTHGYSSHYSDGTSTYATLTAQALGAEIDVIARSGIRFVRVDENNSMYTVYEEVSGLNDKCTDAYDFANNEKDVVIINLGTNDNGAKDADGNSVTDEYIQSETVEFLKLVRKNNPNAEIVWAYGIMGSGRVDAIKAGIKEMNDAGDNKISFYALPAIDSSLEGIGTGNHPTVTTAINRSFGLTEYIAEKMGWNDYNYAVQLAQQLRVAEDNFTADYLKPYTDESIATLKNAIIDGEKVDLATATNEQLKAAVVAIQQANLNLVIDTTEVATISTEEKTATTHYMEVSYPTNIDLTAHLGHKMYLSYDVKIETDLEPTTKAWMASVRNGRAYLTGASAETEIANGLNFGSSPANGADEDFVTITLEIPDAALESGSITKFRLFYYNDTESNMSESEKEGLAWSNNGGVTITVKNVKLLATVAEFVNKDNLKTELDKRKSAEALVNYSDESVTEYNALFDAAQAVYDDIDATQVEINAATTSLKTADAVLKLKDENTILIMMADEKTSAEAHYLSVDSNLTEAFDLTPYANSELVFSYDIRINTTENHPDVDEAGWLNYILNGQMRLFSVPVAQAGNENAVPVGGDDTGKIHCLKNELTNIKANEWLTVTVPVPQAIVDAGQVTKFHIYMYNDLHKVFGGTDQDTGAQGVTMSIRNVKIVKTGGTVDPEPTPVVVDKTALNTAITAAEAITDLTVYTDESVATFTAALTNAKTVAADEEATQEQVDAAATALTTAQTGLTQKPEPEPDPEPVIEYGNVNGSHDEEGNPTVTAEDALLALQIATGKVVATDDEKAAGDVDKTTGVQANDALLILQYATKKIGVFPIEAVEAE